MSHPAITDSTIERTISILLRMGVLVSGAVVLGGGILFLLRHSREPVNYSTFHVQGMDVRAVNEIVAGAFSIKARCIIQTGILCLIATPIARVAFSLVGFALERDRVYCWITAIVLAVLLYSIITGTMQG